MAQPQKNPDLHGNAPDTCRVALLLVDVINDMEYPGAEALFGQALPTARRIARLVAEARRLSVPVIYANDNFGQWHSDLRRLVAHCREDGVRGEPIARLLAPEADDYVVLKPKHSAFYATPLDVLLDYLGTKTLALAGFAGDVCVLLTAADAFLRDFHLILPADCLASVDPRENEAALRYAVRVFKADTTPSTAVDLASLAAAGREGEPDA